MDSDVLTQPQAGGSRPPLRPVAVLAQAGGAPQDDNVEASLQPAREIEEHEVEMYREQDVSLCPVALHTVVVAKLETPSELDLAALDDHTDPDPDMYSAIYPLPTSAGS